jgi:hypothetical protein
VNSESLEPGTYSATITVTDPAADNSPQTIAVSLVLAPRVPPTISSLSWNLLQINAPACGNVGIQYEFYFDYSDPEGDIRIAGGSLIGEPIEAQWQFQPSGFSWSNFLTGAVDGTGFAGSVSFRACIYFQLQDINSVDLTITLMDAGNRQSNSLFTNIPRPVGIGSPPPVSAPQDGNESLDGADRGGDVEFERRKGDRGFSGIGS